MRRTNPRARTPSHLISKSQPARLKGRAAACASMGRNGAGNGASAPPFRARALFRDAAPVRGSAVVRAPVVTFGSDPAGFAPCDPGRGGRGPDAAFGPADAVQRASLSARMVSIRRPLLI